MNATQLVLSRQPWPRITCSQLTLIMIPLSSRLMVTASLLMLTRPLPAPCSTPDLGPAAAAAAAAARAPASANCHLLT